MLFGNQPLHLFERLFNINTYTRVSILNYVLANKVLHKRNWRENKKSKAGQRERDADNYTVTKLISS